MTHLIIDDVPASFEADDAFCNAVLFLELKHEALDNGFNENEAEALAEMEVECE